MDTLNRHNHDPVDHDLVSQSGHWLPAFRPEDSPKKRHPPASTNPSAEEEITSDDREYEQKDTKTGLEVPNNAAPLDAQPPAKLSNLSYDLARAGNSTKSTAHDIDRESDMRGQEQLLEEDDDERLDPAWGIKRMSTAQILGTVKHTTTFPTFTPQSDAVQEPPQVVQQIYSGDRHFTDTPAALLPEQSSAKQEKSQQAIWEALDRAGDSDSLDGTPIGATTTDLADPSEERYDSGLPLVSAPHEDNATTQDREAQRPEQSALSASIDEDTSYFVGMEDEKRDVVPELTRKTTSTVLESLHMQSRDQPSSEQPEPPTSYDAEPADEDNFFADLDSKGATRTESAVNGAEEDIWMTMAADDEFLVEDADDLLPDSEPSSPSSFTAALQQETSRPAQSEHSVQQMSPNSRRPQYRRASSSNPFAPHQPSTSELAELSPVSTTFMGSSRPALAPYQNSMSQRPAAPQHTASFADKSKGGYQSPYDLPMELSKPKKRAAPLQPTQPAKAVPPPPRSSSISDKQLQSPFTPSTPGFPPSAATPAQYSPIAPPARSSSTTSPAANNVKSRTSTSSFFEELPMSSKPRPPSNQGRFTPQHPSSMPPPSLSRQPSMTKDLPPPPSPQPQASQPRPDDLYSQFQLRAPERLDPFANAPPQLNSGAASAVPATRYSPAPSAGLGAARPSPSPRYSPAPPPQSSAPQPSRYVSQPPMTAPPQQAAQRPPSQPHQTSLPFQPRTSSPLVHGRSSVDETSMSLHQQQPTHHGAISQHGPERTLSPPSVVPSTSVNQSPSTGVAAGPRRVQTQSPSRQSRQPSLILPNETMSNRPASAYGQTSPTVAQADSFTSPRPRVQAGGLYRELDFIRPTDETVNDPLERWKGSPVFHFGFGGSVVTTFPRHIPRYGAGTSGPQLKPTVGDVSIRTLRDFCPLPEHITSFPGPLRGKGKKKDVLIWLDNYVKVLEMSAPASSHPQVLPDPHKRHDERILLCRILRSMVEHDGNLDSSPQALLAVNVILAPEVHAVDEATASQYSNDTALSGIYRPRGASLTSKAVDPMALEALRKHLLKGDRQAAVWHAVDHRLWSHALLVASTLPRDLWRQVVQEFVKQEVKGAGFNTESLSALYEIFGGNLDESIDQLVPPSARAGLQMVSKIDSAGPTKNALEGLDRWRETLSLVINNRTQGDHQALARLGQLLAEYGRIEAAHICFLFSKSPQNPAVFGGAEDTTTSIVLLGSDHRSQPFDFARDHEAILLTEVYEFASMVLTGAPVPFMPYLSAFKLRRASLLADEGLRSPAQEYGKSLEGTVGKKTMPYYNPAFLGELEDFLNRLQQIPVKSAGNWGKPTLTRAGGSLFSALSSFVAGDDSDADSKGSGREPTEAGPFAGVAGTPSISRSGSQTDLYGGYPASQPPVPTTIAGSRYAPNGTGSARSSSELTRGRPSLDSQRSPPPHHPTNFRASSYEPVNMMQQSHMSPPVNPYQSFGASPPSTSTGSAYQATPPSSSYMPNALSQQSPASNMMQTRQESYMPTPPPEQAQTHSYEPAPAEVPQFQPPAEQPTFGAYAPANQTDPSATAAESLTSDYSQSYGYEPPSAGYVPYEPEPDSPEEPKAKPKKKSMMDDDDDDYVQASGRNATTASQSIGPSTASNDPSNRAANDAAADAAFRAAAEADAQRAEENKKAASGKGWFGGWLGGKKTDSLDATPAVKASADKVYRANLGQSKMKLYYDKELGKWVNPDSSDVATKTSATPPPPRGTPMPASSSGSMGPPSGPPRSVSVPQPAGTPPLGGPTGSGPPSRASTPASAPGVPASLGPAVTASLNEGGGLAPPSRPSTAMSNASSIDDLLGGVATPGAGRKSVKGKKGGRGGRYIDVMAK